MPNALLPSITLIMLNLGFVISGAITTGPCSPGPASAGSPTSRFDAPDYPTLEDTLLLFSAAVIVANLVGDLLLTLFDHR